MGIIRLVKDICLTFYPKPYPLEKPRVIQFPVNDICNSKCQMCHIWKQKLGYQITPSELREAFSNSLFSRVEQIGINGGEPTLRNDLADLIMACFQKLPRLKSIFLITNALVSTVAISRIQEAGKIVKKFKGNFNVMASLDGVGELHDRVRGRKGNFENARKVIEFIKESNIVTNCQIACTVIKENIFGLHDLLDFAIKNKIYIKYRLGIPHKRLYVKNIEEPFALTFQEKVHFTTFLENLILYYERSELQKFFYRSLIDQIIHGMPRKAGCDWQHRGITVTSRGELLYCAVESKTLGSIVKEDSHSLYFKNKEYLEQIIYTKCASCTHDYAGLPPTKVLVKHHLFKQLKRHNLSSNNLFQDISFLPINKLIIPMKFMRRLNKFGIKLNSKLKPMEKLNIPQSSKILICGWYGTETLGDKLILGGIVYALRDIIKNATVYLTSLYPHITQVTILQLPELEKINILSINESLAVLKEMDLVILGGGPIMAINELAEMIAIFERAVKLNIPTLICGCGVGPLGSNLYNASIKHLLELSSFRIYRDSMSLNYASTLGIDTKNDLVCEDPSWSWFYYRGIISCRQNSPEKKSSETVKLILGLRDWPYKQYAPHLNQRRCISIKKRFEQALLNSLTHLVHIHENLKIIPFPMCTNHYGGDDRWYYRELFRNQSELHKFLDYSVLSHEITPDDAVRIFSEADIALTMRYHSLILSLALGIPSLAVDYTLGKGKVASLIEDPSVHKIDLCNIDEGPLIEKFNHIISLNSIKRTFSPKIQPPKLIDKLKKILIN